MALETFYYCTEYLSPYHKYLIGSSRTLWGFLTRDDFGSRNARILRSQFPCHSFRYWSRSADKEQSKIKYLLALTTISYYFKVSYFFERKFSDEHQAKLPKMLDLKLIVNSYWKFQPQMTTILFWNSFCSNRPLPSSKNPRFQNETKCKTFVVKIRFI